MELWIRTQSKEELIKVYNLSINKDNYILGNLVSDDNKSICDYWILGMYNTKERALEVLDEIQNILKKNQPSIISYANGDIVNVNGNYVYEMPKE